MSLPPLEERVSDGRTYLVDVLMPGFIEADNGVQFGEPCLKGTRIPCYAYWPTEVIDDPKGLNAEYITREQAIALTAFRTGVEWQRSRKRRKRMDDAVHDLWAEIGREEDAKKEPVKVRIARPRK